MIPAIPLWDKVVCALLCEVVDILFCDPSHILILNLARERESRLGVRLLESVRNERDETVKTKSQIVKNLRFNNAWVYQKQGQ